jgi:hypothetical protein
MERRTHVPVEHVYSILMIQQLKHKNSYLHNENHNIKSTEMYLYDMIYIACSVTDITEQLSGLVIYYCKMVHFIQ